MQTFGTTRDAKEFLISRIVTESQLEGVPLTDIERKMLYFSESGWTLPNIDQISDSFDRDYDQAQYEKKIGTLIRNFRAKARKDNQTEFETWKQAVKTLRREDHYLLVLIDAPDKPDTSWSRFLKLAAIGFGIAATVFVASYLYFKF